MILDKNKNYTKLVTEKYNEYKIVPITITQTSIVCANVVYVMKIVMIL